MSSGIGGDIRDTFFQECEDLLEALSDGLQVMEGGGADPETVNAVFRAVHSIKGGAGAFGLTALVRFAHRFETVLDRVRSEAIEADDGVMRTLLRAGDRLADLVAQARDGEDADPDAPCPISGELEALAGEEEAEEEIVFAPLALDFGLGGDAGGASDEAEERGPPEAWRIAFAPHDALHRSGNDPAILLRELSRLGALDAALDASAVPPLEALDPERAYLSWTIRLAAEDGVDEAAIREVFEFVEDSCDLAISPADEPDGEDAEAPEAEPSEAELERRLASFLSPAAEPLSNPAAPEAETEPEPVPEPTAPIAEPAPAAAPAPEAARPAGPRPTIRVDLDRVDRLINAAGELVITQAMLAQRVREAGAGANSRVEAALEGLEGLAREIQDSVMAIRAQPVKPLFQRMQRILREAADATGKAARLVTEGDATEVDKSLVEGLADPLTHMVRNAVDHGLERPERRLAAGKPAEGTVRLSAGHRSGRVVIEVSDDGGGIDRERVRAKAVERGLIAEGAELSAAEIDHLLFLPGFSTAAEVSDLSGRGVGMDVVQSAIRTLGGRVSIASAPGEGSTFSINLPLTLAVLDGMVVEVAGETLVIPIGSIAETLRLDPASVHAIRAGRDVTTTRSGPVAVIDLGAAMGYRGPKPLGADEALVLVETDGVTCAALRVDAIRDQRQVVIKGLEGNYGTVPGIAAATILGDGRIALIVDPDAVLRGAPREAGREAGHPATSLDAAGG